MIQKPTELRARNSGRGSRRVGGSREIDQGSRAPRRNRCLRATDEEWAQIGELARAAGKTRTQFLLAAGLGVRLRPSPDQLTRDAIYQLARIGNNLNQLTHAANTPGRLVSSGKIQALVHLVYRWIEDHG